MILWKLDYNTGLSTVRNCVNAIMFLLVSHFAHNKSVESNRDLLIRDPVELSFANRRKGMLNRIDFQNICMPLGISAYVLIFTP